MSNQNKLDEIKNTDESFHLEFQMNMKKSCPRCGDTKVESTEYVDDRYIKYIDRCDKLFGLNSWPLCSYCYSSGISGVEKCKMCYMALMGPIHCKSTGGRSLSHLLVCNFCINDINNKPKAVVWKLKEISGDK